MKEGIGPYGPSPFDGEHSTVGMDAMTMEEGQEFERKYRELLGSTQDGQAEPGPDPSAEEVLGG